MAPPTAIDVKGDSDISAMVVPEPLTVAAIPQRRAKLPALPKGIAAAGTSEMFKTPAPWKPKAKRWDHILTTESLARKPSPLKGAAQYLKDPSIISLGGGLPSAAYFPIEHLDFKVPSIGHWSEQETKDSGVTLQVGKYDITEEKSVYDLSVALNYGQGTGSPQLLRFVTEHTELVHNPPYRDWQCILTTGNTSAFEMALRMFTERGDYVLVEEYAFTSSLEAGLPLGLNFVGIKLDGEGIIPANMDEILSTWDESARKAKKPRVLYTVPTGQNPTGATASVERRQAIYEVCQKHDIYILEDEPYYFLQMQPYTGANAPDVPPPSSHEEFLGNLVEGYLKLDTDGRVMRLDSFSKVIAPGTRTGWITASEQICERFVRQQETSVQNPSGLSQLFLFKLLDEHFGHGGYLDWLVHLRMEYTKRRDVLLQACEKYLPREVVSWVPPAAGMFLWLQLDWQKHPHSNSKSLLEVEDEIFLASIKEGALVAKGSWFRAEREKEPDQLFFRATFAAAPAGKMDEAIKRLGAAVRASFKI